MNKEILYIACPYSKYPDYSIFLCYWVLHALKKKKGYYAFSPVMHTHWFHVHLNLNLPEEEQFTYQEYIEWDLFIMENLKPTIVLLPGWKESSGCNEEKEFAIKQNLQTKELREYFTDDEIFELQLKARESEKEYNNKKCIKGLQKLPDLLQLEDKNFLKRRP